MLFLAEIRPRIRTWLMALSFVAMFPVLVFSIYTMDHLNETEKQSTLRELRRRTQGIALNVEAHINVALGTLNTLGQSEATLKGDVKGLYDLAKRALTLDPTYRAITLVDPQGHMLFHTSIAFGDPLFSSLEKEVSRRALETNQFQVSGPFVAPISPKSVVAITVPITMAGKRDKCLRIIMLTETLNAFLNKQQLPRGWVAGLMDSQGIILARSQKPELHVGTKVPETVVLASHNPSTRYFESTTLEGVRSMNAVVPIYGSQWFVGMAVPLDLLNQPRLSMMVKMVTVATVWLLVSFLISIRLARYLREQTQQVVNTLTNNTELLKPSSPIRVAELWTILQEFKKSLTETTKVRSALSAVSSQRDQVQDLYENAPCGYHSLDRDGRILNINRTELNWLGVTKEEAVGRYFCEFCTPESQKTFADNFPRFLKQGHIHDLEFELVHKDGSIAPVLISATSVCDATGKFVMSRSTVFDIRERKALERELHRLADTDTLTGLHNRRHFYELANKELARSRRVNAPLALLMIDIDHFKKINDAHGHAMGDAVLQHLARTMKSVVRDMDVVARLGGEEFAILLPHTSSAQAAELAQRMRQKIASESTPNPQGADVNFTVSIGVDEWREGDTDLDGLIRRCDIAMYQAKNSGRNRVVQFTSH